MIDESTEFGALAARHLREDKVTWLTTVTPAGAPVPSPVWFWWDGSETVRIFSLPDTARTKNIERNPRVTLNFAGDGLGGDIVVLNGRATIDASAGPADVFPEYAEKYAWGFERIGISPENFSKRYSAPIVIRLTKLRGHQ